MSTVIAITIVAVVISLSVIAFCMYRQRKRRIEKLRMKALGLDDIPITAGISYQKGESTGGSGEWYRGPVEGGAEIGSDNKPKSGWAPIDMPKRPGEAHVQQIP